MTIKYRLFFVLFILCSFVSRGQFDVPDIPTHQTSVYDYADILSATEKITLENKLLNYADTTSTQIVIAIVKDLNGDTASHVAPLWGHKWGVGQADKDNGVFILVSKDDRDMYIATGYGVQGRLTAGITGNIVRKFILPEFKNGNYYKGLDFGTSQIFKALNGKFAIEEEPWWKNPKHPLTILLLFISVVGGLYLLIRILAFLTRFLPDGKEKLKGKGKKSSGWSLPATKSRRGFKGGFGGGGFSGGGAGGKW